MAHALQYAKDLRRQFRDGSSPVIIHSVVCIPSFVEVHGHHIVPLVDTATRMSVFLP
jgi:hypothetical protein